MSYGECPDCKCPRDWHNYYTGHCYGCNKDCPTQKHAEKLPFEVAQDRELLKEDAHG